MTSPKTMTALLFISMTVSFGLVYSAALDGLSPVRSESGGYWSHGSLLMNKRNGDQRYCGLRLMEAIRNICKGIYAAPSRRSDPVLAESMDARETMRNSMDIVSATGANNNELSAQYTTDMEIDSSDFDIMWPSNPKALALRVLTEGPTHQRIRRNIINECCNQACGVRTLLKYCGRQ